MKNIIAGTAGHIDHGKTALVRALTGIDTDRLEEEKRRGITIDIGFAHLALAPDLRLGFVDVPGHERFVRNMLAGASGIDLVLLVVAADESVMPQTREHFDICRLLGLRAGVVALTKSDLVEPDLVDLVRLEVEDLVAGSFLEGAPIVPVSAVTGAGLDALRDALSQAARAAAAKDASRPFRLPVDRVFTMTGFGTVVTGTLVAGSVAREDEVEIHPGGRRARVRGLQVHGEAAARATAGQRTAINLSGVDTGDLQRGMVLTHCGLFQASVTVDVRLDLLASAKPLKHLAPVHVHTGAAETSARVRLLDGNRTLDPGGAAFARLELAEPVLLMPGDRFIVRRFSPVTTIGGGIVADIHPPRLRRRRSPEPRLRVLLSGPLPERIALLVNEASHGLTVAELVIRTGLTEGEILRNCAGLRVIESHVLDPAWIAARAAEAETQLTRFHKDRPLEPGMPRHDLRASVLPDAPAPVWEAVLAAARNARAEGDLVRLASHRVVLRQDEAAAREAIESAFAAGGLAVPPLASVLAQSGVEAGRARTLLQSLLREKRLVRVSDQLIFHAEALDSLKNQLASHRAQRFTVPVFKDWTGISRKYAIPLLEFLDRERITRRDGDERIVL
ncbi:MAG: selenocysteine-specific translation elongation factor [Bryobacterales bacterium]|nr:selenocysteine-specific translation elongation factor [Bryobacterales bacterium]